MNFALCCAGTWGDIAPFFEIAAALQARHHQVALLAPASYQERAARRRLKLVPTLTPGQLEQWLNHPDMWHPRRFFSPLLEKLMAPSIAPILDWASRQNHRDLLVVSDYSSSPGARLACVRHGLRHLTAWRDAAGLRSRLAPSTLSGVEIPRFGGQLVREAVYAWSDLLAWWKLRPEMRRHGFRPPWRLLDWMVSPRASIGLFPAWFAPPPPDWPAGIVCAGFPRPVHNPGLPAEVEQFLQSGPAPLVATLGSAARGMRRELECIVQEVARRRHRLVLLGPELDQLPPAQDLLTPGFLPLPPLLERCRAFLHHGGIGTSAEALAAGLPQLVIPLAHDQFDNASRLVRLGAALCLPRHRLTPENLRHQLDLLEHPRQARLDPPELVLERICRALEKEASRP